MNTAKHAKTDHPINKLIAERWSPYGFADRPVSDDDLRSLFEAARWSASSYNEQPWRYIVATKADAKEYARVLSCLVDLNQGWAKNAPVLAIGCTHLKFTKNGQPNAVAIHDLGIASGSLSLEATARGLFVHQMAGIHPDKVRKLYHVPTDVQPLTGLAIGFAADLTAIADPYLQRDTAPRTRRPLAEFVFGGDWGKAARLAKTES